MASGDTGLSVGMISTLSRLDASGSLLMILQDQLILQLGGLSHNQVLTTGG